MIKKQVLRVGMFMMMSLPSLGTTGFDEDNLSPLAVSDPRTPEVGDSLETWLPILEGQLIAAIQASRHLGFVNRVINVANAMRDAAYPLLAPEGALVGNNAPQPLPGSPPAPVVENDEGEEEDGSGSSPSSSSLSSSSSSTSSSTSSGSDSDDDSDDEEDEEDYSSFPPQSPLSSDGDDEEEEADDDDSDDGSGHGGSSDGEESGLDSGEEADDDSDEDCQPGLKKQKV